MQKRLYSPLLILALVAAGPATKPSTTSAPAPADFVVTGRVTDEAGKPMPNVTVTARSGTQDQLVRTGTTKTDKAGEYRLEFEPGVHYERALGEEVVGFQPALIQAQKGGYVPKDLGRAGDLAMTDDVPTATRKEAKNYSGVVRIHEPYKLDFVLCKVGSVEETVVDGAGVPVANLPLYLTGPELPPMQETLAGTKTDEAGKFKFGAVPTNHEWALMARDKFYDGEIAATPFTLDAPAAVTVGLTYDSVKHTLTPTETKAEH